MSTGVTGSCAIHALSFIVIWTVSMAATGAAVNAQVPPPWTLEALLEPDPGPPPGMLGAAVAIGQKRALVGNRRNHDLGTDSGLVHAFDHVGKSWRLSHLIRDPAGCLTCDFGAALALDGDRAVVGAPRDGAKAFEAGRAHIYVRRGTRWKLETTLSRPSPAPAELFGSSVALAGRVAVVGAPYADQQTAEPVAGTIADAGAVEVFEQQDDRWIHAATLTSPSAATSAWFGSAVAVAGDLIAVGEHGLHRDGAAAGAVHLYRRTISGWHLEQSLDCPWPGTTWFGFAVALEGGRVLVGAPRAKAPGSGATAGAAFLFERLGDNFGLLGSLSAPWLASGDGLGCSVAIDRDALFVGATGDDEAGEDAGAVYLFTRGSSGFRPAEKLVIPGLSAGDRAGAVVAATRGRLIVGRGGEMEVDPSPGDGVAWILSSPTLAPPSRTSSLPSSDRAAVPRRSQTKPR